VGGRVVLADNMTWDQVAEVHRAPNGRPLGCVFVEKSVLGAVALTAKITQNFWSLLKRSIHGTYVSVEPFHLFRYLDEQAFRYNNRTMTDALRFRFAMRQIVGKRVTYKQLTGKDTADALES
jgi:hypothetical protein